MKGQLSDCIRKSERISLTHLRLNKLDLAKTAICCLLCTCQVDVIYCHMFEICMCKCLSENECIV